MRINNKEFGEWTADDLQVLLSNDAYRENTIKPRLETCGTDCRNVAFINEEMNSGLTLDDERIRKAIIQFRPKLVVIDPIQAYLGSDSDLQIAGRGES